MELIPGIVVVAMLRINRKPSFVKVMRKIQSNQTRIRNRNRNKNPYKNHDYDDDTIAVTFLKIKKIPMIIQQTKVRVVAVQEKDVRRRKENQT